MERLRRDSRALFGRAMDGERVLGYLRQVTDGLPGGLSVQVNVFSQDERAVEAGRAVEPDVLVRAGPPAEAGTAPVRVQTRTYERLLPEVKHVATLGLVYQWRRARQDGFDDVLFVDRDGFVSEGSIWNLCLFDGEQVVWPAAPALRGITMQLVQAGLARAGVPSTIRPVHRDDLPRYHAAVLMNSITPGQPLAGIDTVELPEHKDLLAMVGSAYLTNEPQPLQPARR